MVFSAVATFAAYPGYSGDLKIEGSATLTAGSIWTTDSKTDLKLGFYMKGVEEACATTPTGVANACGIHIHAGTTCDDAAAVGGHYYDMDKFDADPWASVVYESKGDSAYSRGLRVNAGKTLEEAVGHALVVHDQTGARIACGVLKDKYEPTPKETRATFGAYPGYTGDLKIEGGATLKSSRSSGLEMSFYVKGVEEACAKTPTGVANACGIHIHAGTTCEDAAAVGGHYYDMDKFESDPWAPVVYQSKGTSATSYGLRLNVGKTVADTVGHALVVHDQTGARVACGVLEVPFEAVEAMTPRVSFGAYPGYTGDLKIEGGATLKAPRFATSSTDLELAFYMKGVEAACAQTPAGVANACGIHIHAGTSCEDAAAVGGHYYDMDKFDADPWAPVVYQSKGNSAFSYGLRVNAGKTLAEAVGHALVVHDQTGARIACGVISTTSEIISV